MCHRFALVWTMDMFSIHRQTLFTNVCNACVMQRNDDFHLQNSLNSLFISSCFFLVELFIKNRTTLRKKKVISIQFLAGFFFSFLFVLIEIEWWVVNLVLFKLYYILKIKVWKEENLWNANADEPHNNEKNHQLYNVSK